jgi:Ribbon-helix-helix protein, copG family
MAKSTVTVEEKKRRPGRPATGKDPFVGVRIPPALIEQIDQWAKRHGGGRSQAIRRLVEMGLNAKAK